MNIIKSVYENIQAENNYDISEILFQHALYQMVRQGFVKSFGTAIHNALILINHTSRTPVITVFTCEFS